MILMIRVGLGVKLFRTLDIYFNIDVIEQAAKTANKQEVDLLCFGESILQGFHSLNGDYERDAKIAISREGNEVAKIKQIAKDNSLAIAFGYIERDVDNIYSSYLVIDREGVEICNFRRVSRGWKEAHWNNKYKEGKNFGTFALLGTKFIVGLCGDFWMDDDKLPSCTNENVLWPVYIDSDYIDWQNGSAINEYAEQANKIGKNVLLVNSLFKDNQNLANGRAIHFLHGKVKVQLDLNMDGILVCEI